VENTESQKSQRWFARYVPQLDREGRARRLTYPVAPVVRETVYDFIDGHKERQCAASEAVSPPPSRRFFVFGPGEEDG
jgi:hypothetical protein